MNVQTAQRRIFRNASKTYFNATLFFPPQQRADVFTLYAFVRTADNFVDRIPQQGDEIRRLEEAYYRTRDDPHRSKSRGTENNAIIEAFVELAHRKRFEAAWVAAFFASMYLDLSKRVYHTLEETLQYVYGSAEVIGLFMARIMDLPMETEWSARMLGRAMQYINFIRDIDEDIGMGRTYLPLGNSGLDSLSPEHCRTRPQQFRNFIATQLDRYDQWYHEGTQGYGSIPRRMLTPIKTAADMYNWTAQVIARDPFVVFRRKIKPSRGRVLRRALINQFAIRKG